MTKMIFRSFFFQLLGTTKSLFAFLGASVRRMGDFWETADGTINWLRRMRLLREDPPPCGLSMCEQMMKEVPDNSCDGWRWRCSAHKGRKVSIRAGSSWDGSRLRLQDLVLVVFLWALGFQAHDAAGIVRTDWRTVETWFTRFRRCCSYALGDQATMDGHMDEDIFRQLNVGQENDDGEKVFDEIVRAMREFYPIEPAVTGGMEGIKQNIN